MLVLRVAVAGEFFGHGWFAVSGKPGWIPFVTLFGFDEPTALTVMAGVGLLDILLAVLVLLRPMPLALGWMAFWGFFTAALRPLSGGSWLDFVERMPNWGAPLALLLLVGWSGRGAELRPSD